MATADCVDGIRRFRSPEFLDCVDGIPEFLKCPIHLNQCINTYCLDHDEVFCGSCAIIKHRSCQTKPISVVAKDFKTEPEVKESTDKLTFFVTQLREQKEKLTGHLESIGMGTAKCIKGIDIYEQNVIADIKKLAENSRQLVRTKYEKLKTEVDDFDRVENSIVTYVEKLNDTRSEEFLFSIVKNSKITLQESEKFLKDIKDTWTKEKVSAIFETLTQTLNNLGNSFSSMEYNDKRLRETLEDLENSVRSVEYNASLLQEVYTDNYDKYNRIATDVCVMGSGEICVADIENSKLKRFSSDFEFKDSSKLMRFSSDFQFKDSIKLPNKPDTVCEISGHEVAVREYDSRTVHVVAVGETMEITSSFELSRWGYGMAYDAETGVLYAGGGSVVVVCDKTGQELKRYAYGFSDCRQIALSENKQDIYVTDRCASLIVFDKKGTLKMKVEVEELRVSWPLCLLPGNVALVGANESHALKQINEQEDLYGNIVDRHGQPECIYCAVYDRKNSRLIVGADLDKIFVYKLTASK